MTNDHNQAERAAPDEYENGPEGMPRVKRMPYAVLDCIIDHSLFRHLGGALEGEDRDRLHGLMHDTANEALARISAWPVSPAVGEDGLPPAEIPAYGDAEALYTAEQVRQAQREAVALHERVHNMMVEQCRELAYQVDDLRAQLALQSAPNVGMGWISVTDRLPPDGDVVLAWIGDHVAVERWMERHESPVSWSSATLPIGPSWDDHEFEDITHWMPLPSAPQQASQQGANDVG
jgi:hypothetical protein